MWVLALHVCVGVKSTILTGKHSMNTLSLVRDLTTQMNNSIAVPWIAKASFQALSVVHLGWWWLSKGKLYTKQKNIIPLAIGHGANYFIKIEFLRFGARLLLIITRAEECWKQTSSLGKAYRKLQDCLVGRYAFVAKPKWSKSNSTAVFSTTLHNWVSRRTEESRAFAARLSLCAYRIFKSAGKMGMRCWDLFDSLSADNEAMQEVVVNGMKWMDKVQSNQYYYIDKLRAGKPYVEKIILYSNMNMQADAIIEGFVDAVNTTASAARMLNKVSNAGGGAVVDLAKRSGTLAGAALGVLPYLSEGADDMLILDEAPSWSKKLEAKTTPCERFPTIQWSNSPKKPAHPSRKKEIEVFVSPEFKGKKIPDAQLPKLSEKQLRTIADYLEKKWSISQEVN